MRVLRERQVSRRTQGEWQMVLMVFQGTSVCKPVTSFCRAQTSEYRNKKMEVILANLWGFAGDSSEQARQQGN